MELDWEHTLCYTYLIDTETNTYALVSHNGNSSGSTEVIIGPSVFLSMNDYTTHHTTGHKRGIRLAIRLLQHRYVNEEDTLSWE